MTEQPNIQMVEDQPEEKSGGRKWYFWPLVGLIAIVAVFIVGLILALVVAVVADPEDASNWVGMIRDLFIIVLAMEGMLMGIALIVLILQLATLVNLLQNEIQPIVDNANETMSTVKGTTQFLSQNVVEPVVRFGAITAAAGSLFRELFGIRRVVRGRKKRHE